jgi:hypothetical protein
MSSAGCGRRRLAGAWLGVLVGMAVAAPGAPAAELEGKALVEALQDGGYNVYFRHAPTDWGQHDRVEIAGDWTSCDPAEMRQLSSEGRATARRIGDAMRALRGAGGEGAVQRVLPDMGDRAPPEPGAGDKNAGHYEYARYCPRRRARRRDPPRPTRPRAAGSRRRQRRHRRARQSHACCDRRLCQRSRQRCLCPPRRHRGPASSWWPG